MRDDSSSFCRNYIEFLEIKNYETKKQRIHDMVLAESAI